MIIVVRIRSTTFNITSNTSLIPLILVANNSSTNDEVVGRLRADADIMRMVIQYRYIYIERERYSCLCMYMCVYVCIYI